MESYFSAIASRQSTDSEAGIIKGVSVISTGPAQGHVSKNPAGKPLPLFIDEKTLSEVLKVALSHKDGVKVKLQHEGGVGEIVGVLKNFSRDGDKVRADLHLLKSAKGYAHVLELAEKLPQEFGLSVALSGPPEYTPDKALARCTELYSIDLVDQPAANPDGLFAANNTTKPMIELKEIAKILGLAEDATEEQVKTELAKKEKMCGHCGKSMSKCECKKEDDEHDADADAEAKKLSATLAAITTRLENMEKRDAQSVALAQKAELDNLVAEAARDGKVIPLDTTDIYEAKDGVLTIKTQPTMLRKIIDKLAKGTLKLDKKPAKPTKDNKPLNRRDPANAEQFKEWCLERQAEGAQRISMDFASRMSGQPN